MFHGSWQNLDPPWAQRLRLPVYGLSRLMMACRLLVPLLRHPLTSLHNLRFRNRAGSLSDFVKCFGFSTPGEFLAHAARQAASWRRGMIPVKPQVWLFQAYCEKPVVCACRPAADSPYVQPDAQRRFNEFCLGAGRPAGFRFNGGRVDGGEATGRGGGAATGSEHQRGCFHECRIGTVGREFIGEGDGLDLRLKIMLSEEQMADYWSEMLAHQARTGEIIPFVMDVCPFALWLARCSLFQLKSPLGVVFLLQSENRCRTWREYRRADHGRKEAALPVTLTEEARAEKDAFLSRLASIAGLPGRG